ncbi:hypothetical protein L1887_17521 [Cichorium endivia]|nr:hypothetical protein L1887_17521 [Cichorium endivia]
MAGFHLPGDPYFLDEGNNGWLDEEPEEDPEEGQEEDEEMEEEDSEAESKVSDPRFPIREHNAPPPPPSFQGQTPEWAEHIRLWSREQGLVPPYGMSFEIRNGSSADRALPVVVGRIHRQEEQIRATSSQVMDVGATAEVTTARLRRLDEAHDHTSGRVDTLEEDGQTALGMFCEAFVWISESEERIREVERRAEEAEREAAELRAQVDALRGAKRSGSS